MTAKTRLLPLVLLSLFACIVFVKPPAAHAQTTYCASDDGNRHYCNANTSGGVQLTRQRSGSACIQGQTWGWDNRGIWVDRGCRAEFTTNTNTGNWNNGGGNWNNNGSSQPIYCASDDGNRHYCNADTGGGVQLTRQRSDSACIQGQTWGWDNRGIWVDRGCRAEFTTNTNTGNWNNGGGNWNNGGGNWNNNGSSQPIYCASDDGNRHYCNANTRGGVQLTRQRSDSACIQGQTWGWDNRGIWVDRGCRAEFTTSTGNSNRNNGWRRGNLGSSGYGQTFTCSSDDGGRHYCSVPGNGNPNNVILSRQISGSSCIQGQTWGVDQRGLWVDRGCRAEFRSR